MLVRTVERHQNTRRKQPTQRGLRVILIDSDHMPTPLGTHIEGVLCSYCTLHVTYIEDFGWVHTLIESDYTQGAFNDAGEWCEYADGPQQQ